MEPSSDPTSCSFSAWFGKALLLLAIDHKKPIYYYLPPCSVQTSITGHKRASWKPVTSQPWWVIQYRLIKHITYQIPILIVITFICGDLHVWTILINNYLTFHPAIHARYVLSLYYRDDQSQSFPGCIEPLYSSIESPPSLQTDRYPIGPLLWWKH